MASVTRTGTVDSTHHSKTGSTHVYSATVTYTWMEPNPAYPPDPPPEIEASATETHEALDESFYRDFQNRVGKTVTTTYDDSDTNRTVSAVGTP